MVDAKPSTDSRNEKSPLPDAAAASEEIDGDAHPTCDPMAETPQCGKTSSSELPLRSPAATSGTSEAASLLVPEITPIEEPPPPPQSQSNRGERKLGGGVKSASSAVTYSGPQAVPIEEPVSHQLHSHTGDVRLGGKHSAAIRSVSTDAPEVSPIEDPLPHQPQGGNIRLGGSRRGLYRSEWNEETRRTVDACHGDSSTVRQDQDIGSSHAHEEVGTQSAIQPTALPGAHRMYPAGVNPGDVESETVYSAVSDINSGRPGASVVTSDIHGNPIVGFIPYERSGTNQDNLVEGVREYIRNNAPVVDVVRPDENAAKDLISGWCRRNPRVLLAILLLSVVAIVVPTTVRLSSSNGDSVDEKTSTDLEGNAPTSRPSSAPTIDSSSPPPVNASEHPSEHPSTSTMPSFYPTVSIAPTSENWAQIKTIVSSMNASVESAFSDASSPQSRALRWLAEEDHVTSGNSHSSLLAQNHTNRLLDRYALAVLYFSTGGKESWRNQYNWLSGDRHECLWYASYECVEDYPTDWVDPGGRDCAWYAQGSNCEEFGWTWQQFGYYANEACCVCKLKRFTYDMGVYCTMSSDSGDPIVTTISLDDNLLTGTIPNEELGLLENLKMFWVCSNLLEGEIPSSIGYLDNLQDLDLGKNQLRGAIPASIENLNQLGLLDLSMNDMTGTIPQGIGNMSRLKRLLLNRNELTGTIPSSIGTLVNLEVVELSENQLSGRIPPSIGDMTKLRHLSLLWNQLTGKIPSAINQLQTLEVLQIDYNFLTGRIPLTAGLTSLLELTLSQNMLTDSVPTQIGTLSRLESLTVSDNLLNGTIPSNLSGLGGLVALYISSNAITNTLPTLLANLPLLRALRVSGNYLSGTISSAFGNMQSLTFFEAASNKFTGTIPSELGKLQSLQILELGQNSLEGHIPSEFGGSHYLRRFDVSNNSLNGTLPTTFVNLVNKGVPWDLDDLLLHNNSLSGNLTFLCVKNNERLLIFADCAGPSPEVGCSCCNVCCNREGNCAPT